MLVSKILKGFVKKKRYIVCKVCLLQNCKFAKNRFKYIKSFTDEPVLTSCLKIKKCVETFPPLFKFEL